MTDPYSHRFACVVGAPRCGTTFLATCLQDHPDVCFSAVKEPHYFSQSDLGYMSLVWLREVVEAEYIDRFFPHRTDQRTLAEGSVSYLYAPKKLEAVTRLWPDAKFIIAVRDPMALLPSLHQRLIYTGDETVQSFDRAWALVPERMRGRRTPRSCIDPRFLQYEEIGRLGAHVERLFSAVGRERCMVVLFDDLQARPREVYDEVLEFLELRPHERNDFAARRSSCGCKIPALQRFLKRPPKFTRRVLAGEQFRTRIRPLGPVQADPALVKAIFRWRKRLLDWNKAAPRTTGPSAMVRRQIAETYASDVAKLAHLLQRDLGHWLGGAASGAAPVARALPRHVPPSADDWARAPAAGRRTG